MEDSQSPPNPPADGNPSPEPKKPETRVYRPLSRRDLFERAGSLLIGAFGAGVFLPLAGIDSLEVQNGLDPKAVRDKLRRSLSEQEAQNVEEALHGADARSKLTTVPDCACACEQCACACECGCNCNCDGFPCDCLCDCGCSCDCGCACNCYCHCACNCDDATVPSATNATNQTGSAHTNLDSKNYDGSISGTFNTTFEADWNANGGTSSVAGVNNNMAIAPEAPTASASTSTASQQGESGGTSSYTTTDESSTEGSFQRAFVDTDKISRGHIWRNLGI